LLIPDQETEVDLLNYDAICNTVLELLKGNRQRAISVGIHGDWGAGKSSILKMIESQLQADKAVACIWFNGWAFEGFDDAKAVLMEMVIRELYRQRSNVGKVKELATNLLKRVNWLRLVKFGTSIAFNVATGMPSPDQVAGAAAAIKAVATAVGSLDSETIRTRLEDAESILKPTEEQADIPATIHAFRDEFSDLLEEAKVDQLVVLIDDLDRCLPETAIATLEAVRLFLFVPKTAFIIGADEAMIEYAVRKHFPDLPAASGPLPYARNYLEKLVQVPFRIPALGAQETRTYVTLLLVQGIVGENHKGFAVLLAKAKESLNRPWTSVSLLQQDVLQIDPDNRDALNAVYLLAQQIGPILADGTRGNPRQIKRFLNALSLRQAVAKARGFGNLINQPALAKLMLAERFQPDFYEHIASKAMVAEGGIVSELAGLEVTGARALAAGASKRGSAQKTKEPEQAELDPEVRKWFDREWLQRWLRIEPALSDVDLRPYVFVARDKRLPIPAEDLGGLEGLISRLCRSALSARGAELEVEALSQPNAGLAFAAIRERIVSATTFASPPPGLDGLALIAKHHPTFQTEVVALLESLDPVVLGIWVVKGWNESITDATARARLINLIRAWSQQDENPTLKRAAIAALPAYRKEGL
jgi:predicted KAP-like P-loop ATPase